MPRTKQKTHETSRLSCDVLNEESALLRSMLLLCTKSDLCVVYFRRGEAELFIETRHALQTGDVKRLRAAVLEQAAALGWELPKPDGLQVRMNGKPPKQSRAPRNRLRLKSMHLTGVRFAPDNEVILGAASFAAPLDSEIRGLLEILQQKPAEGIHRLRCLTLLQRENLELLLSHMIDGVILCDENLHILFINEKARKLAGMPVKPRRGSELAPTSLCNLQTLLIEAIENGITQMNRVVPLGQDRSRLLGVNIQNVKNFHEQSIGWLMIIRDITASWQSDHMRSIIAVASHELHTPLASIKNTIDLLLDREAGDLTPGQEKFLKIVNEDCRRLQRLLLDVLDLSRLEENKLELDRRRHVRIEFIAARVLESFASLAEVKGVALKSRIAPGLPAISGDRDRIMQILVNLVDNAIKYSGDAAEVVISAEDTGDKIVVAVADQGVGIPAADQEIIFEKFVQLGNLPAGSQRGFGLGLSIAREIVHSHGGEIWLESEPGRGSTFYFSIPKAPPDEQYR